MNFPRILATLPLMAGIAHGAGYQLQERSARGLGRAYSGESAIADDASVLASNPAGMILIPGDTSVSVGLTGIYPEIDVAGFYTGAGGTVATVAEDLADEAHVPFLYLTHDLTENLTIGFGSYTTYGLATNYPLAFAGRTMADKSELKTVNFNPAIAWRLHPKVSIGAGFNAVYADGALNATLPNSLPLLDLAGDDWGYGYNLGLMFEVTERTRIGVHYRSEVDLSLEGRITSAVVAPFNGPGIVDVTLPDTFELSLYHEINDRWAIHGDVTWTGWSDFQQLQPIVLGSPVQPAATPENWNDVWRFSLGTTWKASDRLTLRAGVAYDESPVEPQFRTLRIPDTDRVWLSLGASWHFNPCWSLDVGYTHLFTQTSRINETNAGGNFVGIAQGDTDLVSIGVSGNF